MSFTTDKDFTQAQSTAMGRLYGRVKDHPVMGRVLLEKKAELDQKILRLGSEPSVAQATLFFAGKPVIGSKGIDLQFVGEALPPYQEMVKSQYSLVRNGRLGTRGPRKGDVEARLLLTGLPRGSVGLELSAAPEDLISSQQLSEVMVQITRIMSAAASSDEAFAQQMEGLAPRTLDRLKDFLSALSKNEASLRLVTSGLTADLSVSNIRSAWERVDQATLEEKELTLAGVFRGARLEQWRFDFRPDNDEAISGRLSDDMTEDFAASLNALTNKRVNAKLFKATVTPSKGNPKATYLLLGAEAIS